ncbi:hypothetical protein L9F63_014688, partial [Diploptera punctata]
IHNSHDGFTSLYHLLGHEKPQIRKSEPHIKQITPPNPSGNYRKMYVRFWSFKLNKLERKTSPMRYGGLRVPLGTYTWYLVLIPIWVSLRAM